MGGTSNVTPRAKALGDALRQARTDVGLGVRELARTLGMEHGTISRYETGRRSPKPEDVATILAALGVNGQRRDELLHLARDPDRPQWLSQGMTEQQRQLATLLNYEHTAARIVDVAPLLVPGLLQTADYARALMREGDVPADEITTRVATRLGRRDTLTRRDAADLLALVGETVLTQNIGGPRVMADQLRHLERVATDASNVEVRIIPSAAGWHPGLEGPFVLVEPRDESDEGPVVHLEGRHSVMLHEPADVDAYRSGVEKVLRVALSPAESVELIARAADRRERDGEVAEGPP